MRVKARKLIASLLSAVGYNAERFDVLTITINGAAMPHLQVPSSAPGTNSPRWQAPYSPPLPTPSHSALVDPDQDGPATLLLQQPLAQTFAMPVFAGQAKISALRETTRSGARGRRPSCCSRRSPIWGP